MANIAKALSILAGKHAVGDGFFTAATAALLEGTGCLWAGIAYLTDDGTSVRNIALAGKEAPFGTNRVPLEGTPIKMLYANPSLETIQISDDLAERFPDYSEKLGGGSYSFTAALFHGSDGNPAGHFFVVEAAPIAWEPQVWDFLKLVAERVGAEFTLRDGFADATWMDSLIDDTGTALVVTDTSGLILLANDTYANWAGFESSADVVGSNMEQWIHRDALSKNSMSVSKLLRNGVVDKYESVLVNRDGVQREVSVVATVDRTPAGTRLKALMRDIHRRKNAERARHESESRFRNLIEGSLAVC